MELAEARLTAAVLSGGTSNVDIYTAALRAARAANPAPKRILDYGSGVGEFIAPLRAAFPDAEISAADIMERPANLPSSVKWYRGDLNDSLPAPDGGFDLVFAIEVIEHLENPRHMLRDLARVLEPGGVAIVTTPNTGSIRSLMNVVVRGHHALFDETNYPAHITPVMEIDFTRAGMESGFKSPRFFYTDIGSIPKLLRWKWQRIPLLGSVFKGKPFSDNYGAVLVKP